MIFYHTGALGDFLYSLSVVKQLEGKHSYLIPRYIKYRDAAEQEEPEYREFYSLVSELTRKQKYIEKIIEIDPFDYNQEWYKHTHDFTRFRNHFSLSQCSSITLAHALTLDQRIDFTKLKDPWLEVPAWNPFNSPFTLIHRTKHYHIPNFDWSSILVKETKPIYFVGFYDEWKEFKQKNDLPIHYIPTPDLYTLARLIKGSSHLYCNSSVALVIAQGLGHPYSLENGQPHVAFGTPNETLLN